MKKYFEGFVIMFLLSVTLASCGARKTHKSETIEEVRKDSVSKTKEIVISEFELNKQVNVCEENFVIEPIELNKPIEVTDFSGKTTIYKNARIKHEVKTDKSIIAKAEKTSAIGITEVGYSVISKSENTEKSTERESPISLWWLIMPVTILVGVIYFSIKHKDVVLEEVEDLI